jgi:hypothetical protein
MILTKEEAICLTLSMSKDERISSLTKLNKLIARLNLHLVPIDIDFTLNKYGSFNSDLSDLSSNTCFEVRPYTGGQSYHLLPEGEKIVKDRIMPKLLSILSADEIENLNEEIMGLSHLPPKEISDDEHRKLFLDVDDRHKLIQSVNILKADLAELYGHIDDINATDRTGIRLRALIEYCHFLVEHLSRKFSKLEDKYDFNAYMYDYYFRYQLGEAVPFLQAQMESKIKDGTKINKYYQYFVNSVGDRYPFSLDNGDLFKIAK